MSTESTVATVTVSALMDSYRAMKEKAEEQGDTATAANYQAAYDALAQIQQSLDTGGALCLPYSGSPTGRRLYNLNNGEWGGDC